MPVLCGHCGSTHPLATDVRACYLSGKTRQPRSTPTGTGARRSAAEIAAANRRLRNITDVLMLLAEVNGTPANLATMQSWSADPAASRLVGYRTQLVLEAGRRLTANGQAVTPSTLAAACDDQAKSVGRDAGLLLEGRDERRSTGRIWTADPRKPGAGTSKTDLG